MNIIKSIKHVWQNDAGLSALLPPEKVFGARREGPPSYPYAVVTFLTSTPLFRTSKANVDRELIQIAIYAEKFDQAAQIQLLMRDVLRDATVEDDDGTVVLFEKAVGERTYTEGGVTQAIEQFTADISKNRRN